MDTMLPSHRLTDQHQRIDQGVQGAVDGTGTIASLATSLALLRQHLYVEETLLFPPLATAGLAMPVFVMKREHGAMWPLLQELSVACESGASIDTLGETAAALFRLLRIHNSKEEQIVYATADRLASERGDGALQQALAAAPEVPDDWICEMQRARDAHG